MYTQKEVLEASLEYCDGNELAANVFVTKYALQDNDGNFLELTPDDMHHRLAKELARIDKDKFKTPLTEEEIYSYLKDFKKIIPQGSVMYGCGNTYKYVTLSNCYTLQSPYDSYLGINYLDAQIAQISSRRGGVGWDMSTLRPTGTPVLNAAGSTTGVVSFMHRYSNTIREVCQSGRRGASLQSLSITHPDIEEFIVCKNNDTDITGSNISVQFTDSFMKKVKKTNETFQLQWPINSKTPSITQEIDPQKLWGTFIESAWQRAEPGAIFMDTVHKYSTSAPYDGFKEVTCNPCQPAWAKVLTHSGISDLSDVNIGDRIWSVDGWTTITNKVSNGVKDVYKFTTTSGIFYGTKEHRIVIDNNNTKVEAKDAECINIITGPEFRYETAINIDAQTVMDGLVIGDGSVHKASNGLVGLHIGDNDQEYFISEVAHLIGRHRPGITNKFYEIETNIISSQLPYTYERSVPHKYIYGNRSTICSFLRGLFSANGSVCDNRITLKTSSKILLEQVQLMLSSIGIRSYYTTNKSSKVEFANGEYICKQSYDLNITTDRDKFVYHIGFIQQYKNDKIIIKHETTPKTIYDIISVEHISTEEVYDITVNNKTHTYWSQGCNVSNCAEQIMPANSCCRLICINMYQYVTNKFLPQAQFDYETFTHDVKIMQRLADNIVDLDIESIDRIIEKIKSDPEPDDVKKIGIDLWTKIRNNSVIDRRTGCGIVGLADTLAALNLPYCSNKSIRYIDKLFKSFKLAAFEASVDMAQKIGPFEVYDSKKDITSQFIQDIKEQDIKLYNRMKKYGRRNMTLLTIAPTGSVSLLTQTSSGLEPVFMLEYTRRKKINPSETNVEADFTDSSGDKWTEFDVSHTGLTDWRNATGKTDANESPYYKSCAHDIDYRKKIELQGVIQKHIDNSISVTTNLPADIDKETVSELYLMAWKLGCKGFTIYRDGCRSGVLVSKDKQETKFPTERPRKLPCDIHHITVKGQQYFILVGLLDGKPYEVFAGKNGFLPRKTKTGTIIRKKKNFYKAVFDDVDEELSPITMATEEMEEVITRLTSGLLRTGADMLFIVQQLEKVGERQTEMYSFARSVARALKKYIPNGTKEGVVCPECEADALVRQEGCITCQSCGYSKCT